MFIKLASVKGRSVNPGYCIETALLILEETRNQNWNKELVEMGKTIFNWAWKRGWDEWYGGIINFKDCKNFPYQDYSQDMKFWWPQCETVITTLYLYIAKGEEKYLDLHNKHMSMHMLIFQIGNMESNMAIYTETKLLHNQLKVVFFKVCSVFHK